MAGVQAEIRAKWVFGAPTTAEGGDLTNSTGTGTRIFVNGFARENMFYIETAAACTCSYQILAARTQAGATQILSSATMGAASLNMVHITGPLVWVAPRIKTITSTSVNVTVELFGN